ncbi:hypothetical protein [Pseudomonas sp. RIT-PI-a]|uniref:hypothetical protein n=1 Tax=Pseudomonas sp. RIT-PI-a TaxID=1681194 RepID=UPI0013791D1C|nr:hypothetical protein [Pseudomonas sp. RIT-PI-a]
MDSSTELGLLHWVLDRQRQVGVPHLAEQPRYDGFLFGWHWLFALAALDLRINLISTGIKQVDGPILQRPKVAV